MIRLKNASDQERMGGSTIDTILTEHPITRTREWTKLPVDPYTGQLSKMQAKGFDPNDKSKEYHIIIKPGETINFGEGQKFNEEQAEYIYRQYGNKETLPVLHEAPTRNWLVEVDENGQELKGQGTLHDKYRMNYAMV